MFDKYRMNKNPLLSLLPNSPSGNKIWLFSKNGEPRNYICLASLNPITMLIPRLEES